MIGTLGFSSKFPARDSKNSTVKNKCRLSKTGDAERGRISLNIPCQVVPLDAWNMIFLEGKELVD